MQYQIQILDRNLTQKAIYDNFIPNYSTGGIVEKIQYSIEPNGNSLEASIDGIPNLLNISHFDLIRINTLNPIQPAYLGYFVEVPNNKSKKKSTYRIKGLKSLLYSYPINKYVRNSTGFQSYRTALDRLESFLPSYINYFENLASTTLGVNGNLAASSISMGEFLDEIVNAHGGGFSWGVTIDKTLNLIKLFFRPDDTNPIDLTNVEVKKLEYQSTKIDAPITQVDFVFSIPNGWDSPSCQKELRTLDFGGNNGKSVQAAPITYTYRDTTLANTYGLGSKRVELVLSDTFLKKKNIWQFCSDNGLQENFTYANVDVQTNSGSTNYADVVNALFDGNDSTWVENRLNWSSAGTLMLAFAKSQNVVPTTWPYAFSLDTYVGLEADFEVMKNGVNDLNFEFNHETRYMNAIAVGAMGTNYTDEKISFNKPLVDIGRGKQRFIYQRRNLLDFQGTESDLGNQTAVYRFYFSVWNTNWQTLQSVHYRVYNLWFLQLNTEMLDEYAKSLIRVPSTYPVEIGTSNFIEPTSKATVKDADNNTITVAVKRVDVELSNDNGFLVTYSLDYDDRTDDNIIWNRILETKNNQAGLL